MMIMDMEWFTINSRLEKDYEAFIFKFKTV